MDVTVTELFFTPALAPVTLTLTAQVALPASAPADRLTLVAPAVALAVPPQVLLSNGVDATTRPTGSVSVNASAESTLLEFGLVMLKVSDVVPFSGMLSAPNDFVIDGGAATLRLAVAVLPVPPLVDVTAPVVLVY